MFRITIAAVGAALMIVAGTACAQAQQAPARQIVPGIANSELQIRGPASAKGGTVLVPATDVSRGGHTTYKIFVPNKSASAAALQANAAAQYQSPPNPPYAGYLYETPASLACIYGLAPASGGCNSNKTFTIATSNNNRVICIVAFGHDTTALADLQTYSTQFSLPAPQLTIMYPGGSPPAVDQGDAIETSLDLDMAHAMSPNSPIILVEGPDDLSTDDKFGMAVQSTVAFAVQQVQNAGGGVISISYGGTEFPTEVNYDSSFQNTNEASIFVSSGDSPATSWPAVSPNVIAVGGTGTSHATLNPSAGGQFKGEVAWDQGGGGFSTYFAAPPYQSAYAGRLGNVNARATPDVAAVGDPATGVWVYCSTGCGNNAGWSIYGGTSVASPLVASAMANAGILGFTSVDTLSSIYANPQNFTDIGRGVCGPYAGYLATTATAAAPTLQYDLCTGMGSPHFPMRTTVGCGSHAACASRHAASR